ncbi:hypothetical protein BHUM_05252 [Candidatus Burkholderia humilis]|nr:hypothetical protein BHUM_05252 [Candidatus Burkholderia humilis]
MDSGRILQEAKRSATSASRFDVFLSHASKDAKLILGVKALLEERGFVVYVDWVDDAHADRSQVDRETADLLRQRMRQSASLIWVATDATSNSKWMPWELGYFDGFAPGQVATIPLVDNPGESFKGQEYLSLYPLIGQDHYIGGRKDVFVEDRSRRWATLDSFAKGTTRWSRYSN